MDGYCKGAWELGNNCGICSRCRESLPAYRTKFREAITLLAEFVAKAEPRCKLDHNGFCQSHGCGAPCLVARANAVLGGGG